MDPFASLQERASKLGNHNHKYIVTAGRMKDRLTRRLEVRGVLDKVHLYSASPDLGAEMDTIVSVSNDEQEALDFLGCYYALQFLSMNLGALDALHLDLLSSESRTPIYRQFMMQSGVDFRALTSSYMQRLMDRFLAKGDVPEFVLLGTGTRADQDDIDVGVVVGEEGDRGLLDRAIGRLRTEMLRRASCLHFHLSEHVGTRTYSATIQEYEALLDRQIHDFVIITEMLGAARILGSRRLFETFRREVTDRYYHRFGENIYHEGYLRGIVGEIRALLAHPVRTESIHPKDDGLRMIKGLISAMKAIFGVQRVNAWEILDELKERDPDNRPTYETLEESLSFLEIFRHLYQLLVVQEEDIPLREANTQDNLQVVASQMGYQDVGIVKAWNHLVIHYYEYVNRARESVAVLMPSLTRHLGAFSIFSAMAEAAPLAGEAGSVGQNIAAAFIREAAFFTGTRFWEDVLTRLESEDQSVLSRFVADVAALKPRARTRLLRQYAKCAAYAPLTVLRLIVLIRQYRGHPEAEAISVELTRFVLEELKPLPTTPTRFCMLFFLYPEFVNDFLDLISDEDRRQVRELVLGHIYDEDFAGVRDALVYLSDLHIQCSRPFKRQLMIICRRYPKILHHLREFDTLRHMAQGFFAESQRMPGYSRKKELLGDYYDLSYLTVGLETLAGKPIEDRNARFTEFSDNYVQSLFDLSKQEVDEEAGEPVDTRDLFAVYAAGGNAREQAFDDDYDMFFVLNSDDEDVRAHCDRIAARMNTEILKRGVLPHYRLADHFGHYVTLARELRDLLTAHGEDLFVDQSQVLGSRMVVGSHKFEEDLEEHVIEPLIYRDSERYVRQMIQEIRSRHSDERARAPCTDIKECKGGLRDIEMMMLVLKARYGVRMHLGERFVDLMIEIRKEHAADLRVLRDGLQFLKNLRDIHRLTVSADDFIQQDSLESAAHAMGIRKNGGEYDWEEVARRFQEWTEVVSRTIERLVAVLEREEPDLLSLLASVGFDFRGKVETMIARRMHEQCAQCDVCLQVCPGSRELPSFDPGAILRRALFSRDRELAFSDTSIWLCTSCYECYGVCPLPVCPMEVMFALKRYICRLKGIPPEVTVS